MSTLLRTFQVDSLQVEVYRQEVDLVTNLVEQTRSNLRAAIDRQDTATVFGLWWLAG